MSERGSGKNKNDILFFCIWKKRCGKLTVSRELLHYYYTFIFYLLFFTLLLLIFFLREENHTRTHTLVTHSHRHFLFRTHHLGKHLAHAYDLWFLWYKFPSHCSLWAGPGKTRRLLLLLHMVYFQAQRTTGKCSSSHSHPFGGPTCGRTMGKT